jgi:YD repeat-containing protein
VKTGRLLKFRSPGGEVQAYLYFESGRYHATVYPTAAPPGPEGSAFTLSGADEGEVERAVRAWVAEHHLRAR